MSGHSERVRVLVVDDNPDGANSLARLLRILGFEAEAAYGGQEALDAAHAHKPDCVLSDIGMPGIDGYQLAALFRQDESLKDIPLVAITAYAEPERAMTAGFDHHFVKPADPYALHDALRKILKMDERLDRTEQLVQKQGEIITKAIEVMEEVKDDVKEIKEDVKELKEDLKELKDEMRSEE